MAKLDNIIIELDLKKFYEQVEILNECAEKLKKLDTDVDIKPVDGGACGGIVSQKILIKGEDFVANTLVESFSKNIGGVRDAMAGK